jgi:hypothetical protein
MPAARRPTKITFVEMRESGVRGLPIYCADYRCSRSLAISGDRWPDPVRLSDIEPQFVCKACGKRGADVRPHFALARMGSSNAPETALLLLLGMERHYRGFRIFDLLV